VLRIQACSAFYVVTLIFEFLNPNANKSFKADNDLSSYWESKFSFIFIYYLGNLAMRRTPRRLEKMDQEVEDRVFPSIRLPKSAFNGSCVKGARSRRDFDTDIARQICTTRYISSTRFSTLPSNNV
jgi:hypothetical protein